jgi:asparagine synthase (glutamine-hydrolysing)
MCGINGAFAFGPRAPSLDVKHVEATRDAMYARGPDGKGLWVSEDKSIAFGHRRLSIIDLSDRASQPMISASRRLIVTFNGEIYNYPALRADLERQGVQFRTTSDTEVLLHLFERDGPDMVHRLRGMFAFAIWDTETRRLFIARDPYGIKPLYTATDGQTFRFASQVKALLAGGGVDGRMDPAGAVGFYLWGSVPEPFTIHRGIRSLPAGSYQIIDANGPQAPKSYWSLAQTLAAGETRPLLRREIDAHVKSAALDSVDVHMLADVEVGIFLSAGVDSGALMGLMRDAGHPVKRAITLAFSEFIGTAEDEAPLAREVAGQYGAEHIVRRVDRAEFIADLPAIMAAMDQPSIDGVNTWFVAKAAKEAGLKVAISGLGGDEIFAGYKSFEDVPRWVGQMRATRYVPGLGTVARSLARALGLFHQSPKAAGMLEFGATFPGAYLLKRGLLMPFELKEALDPETIRSGLEELRPLERVRAELTPEPKSPLAKVATLEGAFYMRNQLLRDADWAGMAHSIEIRTPLVDSILASRLAPCIGGFGDGVGKAALARSPTEELPDNVLHKTKTGFAVPTGRWMAEEAHVAQPMGLVSRAWAGKVFAEWSGRA